jgi:hypothetical protein
VRKKNEDGEVHDDGVDDGVDDKRGQRGLL